MILLRTVLLALAMAFSAAAPAMAQNGPVRVLWVDANPGYHNQKAHHRQAIADHLTRSGNGQTFASTFVSPVRPGTLARALGQGDYDIVVIDSTSRNSPFNAADLQALQAHYASGHRAIMLDGSLWIRSVDANPTTRFPGTNGSSGGLTVNQMAALAQAGGGTFIGTDHDDFQVAANAALGALVPGARFSGTTVPSTDGDFIGRSLLAQQVPVRAADILNHWQTIPSQGETPVGTFTDFMGQPVTFYSLVETADKPGGGRKRPYVSASFDPGGERTAIGSTDMPAIEEAPPPEPKVKLPDNMPTRKGPPT